MREVHELFDDSACVYEITPWHFYRSSLPFIPSSSLIFEWYRHLSDPIHVFSISGDFAGRLIPLSDDALQAQEVMRAKQRELPTSLDEQGRKTLVINYKDEFLDNDVRNGTVTCAALSRDGRHIALGFGSGVIEVADIDDQCTVSRFRGDPHSLPAWIEFVQGRTVRIATEDTDGNISILGHSTRLVNLGPLPSDPYPAVTAVSDNGSFVLRVPRNPEKGWYENTTVLCVSGDPSVKPLASPFTPSGPSTVQPLQPRCRSSFPLRHMIGFSPTGRYVGAYDKNDAFVWSTDSCQLVSRFCVHDLNNWIINTGVVPPCSYATPKPTMFFGPTIPLILDEGVESPESMPMHDSDESWLTCPFYDLSLSMADSNLPIEVRSFAAGRVPLIPFTRFLLPAIWFNGRVELFAPFQYEPIGYNVNLVRNGEAWYGDRLIYSDEHEHEHDHRDDRFRRAQGGSIFSLPQASRNGTRFLIQGRMKAPLVVDISQVI
ncbi:uncharacterized protein EI90DRAFT_315912 [Cantharellus anzutake]|uniref:uncharacterized protein n=1 Tax=Cantharellus anzutake TaxID=1750568 RepID=UPI0019089C8F|nr:uncharacterized protein EI90DRAFT_315912 [Cantharellus anzutake]KAF8335302.1 hypothetical protein EI90DRAFT_315912 [Cantharellus anzutake]